jgi:hypothetical protein
MQRLGAFVDQFEANRRGRYVADTGGNRVQSTLGIGNAPFEERTLMRIRR